MTDVFQQIESLRKKLTMNDFPELANLILQYQTELGTPGEVFQKVCYSLNAECSSGSNAYKAAKEEIDTILDYGRSINYL